MAQTSVEQQLCNSHNIVYIVLHLLKIVEILCVNCIAVFLIDCKIVM